MAVKEEELGHKMYNEAGVDGPEQFGDVAWELMGRRQIFWSFPLSTWMNASVITFI